MKPLSRPAMPMMEPIPKNSTIARWPRGCRRKSARGVFSTGVLVQDGPGEFVLDFLQGLARPPAIVARVVLSPLAMVSFVNSLKENLGNFTKTFGTPQPLPKPPTQNRPTIQELYEHFKLPEELMSGVYSNSFLIAHAPSEFVFDFITGFFPTAAVACANVSVGPADSADAGHVADVAFAASAAIWAAAIAAWNGGRATAAPAAGRQ